nr:phosphatidylinositol-3-phosphatase myotubularin-1-like isoform X3 [Malus domestica]
MAAPKHSSGRSTSFMDSSESEKMEATGSWDALDWTIEPVSRSVSRPVSHVKLECLLEAEQVQVEGYGVVLVNTDEAGTLIVTNYRLLFLSEGTRNVIALGTIPLATIEKFTKIKNQESYQLRRLVDPILIPSFPSSSWLPPFQVVKNQPTPRQSEKIPSRRLLQVIGKDMRTIVFGFRPKTRQRRAIFDALSSCTKPTSLWDLYAFVSGPSKFGNTNPKVRLLNEYFRLLGKGSLRASMNMIEDGSFTFSNDLWRISSINSSYIMCQSYPFALMVPKSITDEEVLQASNFRARGRLPVVTWYHPKTGAVLARSSQPLVGLMMNMRSNTDEKIVAALCTQLAGTRVKQRKLYIADARPRKNALANGAMGGGSESSSHYSQSEIVFFGIDNIHAMRESFARLRDYLDTHGAASSDGMSSFLALVEKDWLAFGHPFADRVGMPAVMGSGNMPSELTRQASAPVLQSSPSRHSSASQAPTSHAQNSNDYSPIFLQWVDCVSQLLRMYPFAFEFSSAFLVDLLDCVLSCRFGNFLCNSERERQQCGVPDACGCMWVYFADLRASQGSSHVHYNYLYDPLKHDGPLLPPAAALAPTLWPQFHLRWACSSEAQVGGVEAQFRQMDVKFSELQKEKEMAERKAKEITTLMESLTAELQNEKQVSSSAKQMAKRASRESDAIKRAVQSLGCKVHFSNSGDCTVGIESSQIASSQKLPYYLKREADGTMQRDEKLDLSLSITVMADDDASINPIGRVCETLCPLGMRDGGCRWPDAGCAQLGSQFLGLKVNYEAFDKLSIYDSYFQPK